MVKSESESHSVVSDSLRPHGLYSLWNMVKGITYNPEVTILFCLNFIVPLWKDAAVWKLTAGMDHKMNLLYTMAIHSPASFCLKLLSKRYTNTHS